MKKTPTIFHPSVWWPQVLMDCNLVQCRTFPCASLFGLKLVILDRQFEVYKYYSKHCALGNKGVNNQLYHNMILYRFVGMTIWSRYHSVTIRFRFSSQACDRYDAISYAHLTQSFTHPHLDNGGQERRRQMCVAVTEKKKKWSFLVVCPNGQKYHCQFYSGQVITRPYLLHTRLAMCMEMVIHTFHVNFKIKAYLKDDDVDQCSHFALM